MTRLVPIMLLKLPIYHAWSNAPEFCLLCYMQASILHKFNISLLKSQNHEYQQSLFTVAIHAISSFYLVPLQSSTHLAVHILCTCIYLYC